MKKISTMQAFSNEIVKEQKLTIGMDLGDRWSFYCVLDEAGKIILEQKVATTPEAMKQTFGKIPRSLIAIETGTHSPWVSRLLTELGHEVIVAHAQKVELITKSNRKDDRHDARTLARLARIDPELLGPVRHRSAKAQIHLTVIRARAELVSARTALVNAARGLVKSFGERLPKCGTYQVNEKLAEGVSAELRDVLAPLLREVASLNERIKEYDERMEKIAKEVYPEVSLLQQVKGVGTQIALTYILTIEDPYRFPKSRQVGCFLGSTSGCGCDFPNVMLQNGEWPTVETEEAEKDELDKARDISDQHNRDLLVSLLRANGTKTVELYGLWLDGNEATKSPQAFENISLDRILESNFCFKEQVLYRVHLESDTAN